MLPERLSTDLTSLNADEDRLSVVIEFVVAPTATIESADVYGARVRNHAKLAYNSVGAWLTGAGRCRRRRRPCRGMDAQLKLQDGVAQALARGRHEHGRARVRDDRGAAELRRRHGCAICKPETPNRAKALIENLMVAANGVTARFLDARGFPSIRRVVRAPERWDRIVALAARAGDRLPSTPDRGALDAFLAAAQAADPDALSRSVADRHQAARLRRVRRRSAGRRTARPFRSGGEGLRALDGAQSPLSRSAHAASAQGGARRRPCPYRLDELERLAAHCTKQEDAANKVERQVRKSAAALRRRLAHRRGIRRARDRRVVEGHVRASHLAADRRQSWSAARRARRRRTRPACGCRRVDVDRGFIDFVVREGGSKAAR